MTLELKKFDIDYKIKNMDLFQEAFIHKSYTKRPSLENEKSDIKIADKPLNCIPLKTKYTITNRMQ